MIKIIPSIITVLYLLSTGSLLAQDMEVSDATTPPLTPENLISNIFLGEGVEVLDVTFKGNPLAVGYFTKGQNEVGIERGIVMTTGRAASSNCSSTFGANCLGDQFSSYGYNNNETEVDLASIANGQLYDVAKFTITFIPTADTLRFKYVFASEEYPEYSCTSFNDVFGFFISGPGLNGTFQNNGVNIAKIPGTALPVSINNIHPPNPPYCDTGAYDQYYNNNNGFNKQPVYDGYLDVFVAEVVVVPCETYTIKLCVSDVGDDIFDTGVFLEAKSFGTGSLKLETSTVSLDGAVAEGCSGGAVIFSLPQNVETNFPLDYKILGTAENGVDYDLIQTNLFIPAGERSLKLDINAIEDLKDEGLESIGFDVQRDICNRDTVWIFIRDNKIKPPDLGPDTLLCRGKEVRLDGTLPVPLPDPPFFTNANDYVITKPTPVYAPIQAAGVQPLTLGPGVIRSVCVNIQHNWVDDVDLYLLSPGGQFIELSSDNGANCDNYNQVCFTPAATTPINYVYPWPPCSFGEEAGFSAGTFQPEGVWEDLWDGENPTNGNWQLLVLDDQGGFDGTLLDWSITFEPLYKVFYRWEPASGLSCLNCPDPTVTSNATTNYVLTAWDTYGCEVTDSILVEVKSVLSAPAVQCAAVTDNSITFQWPPVVGAEGYEVNINGTTNWVQPNNGEFSHIFNGLSLNDTVTLAVRPLGECDGNVGTATCFTPDCDAATLIVVNQTDATCRGRADGTVRVVATGGAGGFRYVLDTISNTSGVFTGLAAGVYPITVIDALDCPKSVLVAIGEPDSIELQEVILQGISCNGLQDGSATIKITGGTHPYLFNWNGTQTDSIATQLSAGTQTITGTDAKGCFFSKSFEMTEPPLLLLNMAADSARCFGTNTGASLVLISGGTEPYLIQWGATAGNATTALVENLPAGNYSVEVRDKNGCDAMADVSVFQPSLLATAIVSQSLTCNQSGDGQATINVAGGSPAYAYLWSNGDTTSTALSLDAEAYFVTITDAKGCSNVDSVLITEPAPLELSLLVSPPACFSGNDGAVNAQVSGGIAPYSYNWSNGGNTPELTGLTAGNYCLTVTEANGCSVVQCTDVTGASALVLSAEPFNATCNGRADGKIGLTVSGGNPAYSFTWSNGETTEDIGDLQAGVYTVIVTDANGCTDSIQTSIGEPPPLELNFRNTPVECFGASDGSSVATAGGGALPYTYQWSDGTTGSEIIDIPAGIYTLTLTDGNGCTVEKSTEILQPANALTATASVEDVSCHGLQDGRIQLAGQGGTPPYLYSLDGDNYKTNPQWIALASGYYDAYIKDAYHCMVELSQLFIDEPLPLLVDLGPDTLVVFSTHLQIFPTILQVDSLEIETYQWTSSNPQTPVLYPDRRVGEFVVISPTTARLVVTDTNGCEGEDLINIFVRELRSIQVPTGFSPGAGGNLQNDLLHVHGSSFMVDKIRLFRVFDRWGELIFEAKDFPVNDLNAGWDGTFKGREMPSGVYVWYLEVDFVDGSTESYKGHTTLIK